VLKWNASAVDPEQLNLLPIMRTDVTLQSDNRVIILDAKYYKDALQEHYGTPKIHSANLYQLSAYLRAAATELDGIRPEGILVYPVGGQTLNASFVIDGYSVRMYTVNLNQEWSLIERDLLQLVQTN
jgi:5-methylcytosine-specific restriction enzyme subunit McrC